MCIRDSLSIAQSTAIPDANFEQALIDLGLDATLDGQVLTSNIDTVTYLNVTVKNITDLTGIEDFIAIENLQVGLNQLNSIDVTQNTNLILLEAGFNQLTSIDLTQNLNLENLVLYSNQISSIDVSNNPNLKWLAVWGNQLTSLDISQNPLLLELGCQNNMITELDISIHSSIHGVECSNNQLTCLNVKNGNNINFQYFNATNNPSLTCIEVDDTTWANTNWTVTMGNIDTSMSFSTNCPNPCTVGIEENSLSNLNIYPNPTNGSINIDLEETESNINLRLIDALGRVLFAKNYKTTNQINFDLDAPKGFYLLQLESDGVVITKKIVKE